MYNWLSVKRYRARFIGKTVVIYENNLQAAKKLACKKAGKIKRELVEIYRT